MQGRETGVGRRVRLSALAIVAVAVAVTVGLIIRESEPGLVRDGVSGITMARPAGWSVQRFTGNCFRGGPSMLVANVDRQIERSSVNRCAPLDVSGAPPTAAAVRVMRASVPFRLAGRHRVRLPLRLSDLPEVQDAYGRTDCSGCRAWYGLYAAPAGHFVVEVVVGSLASEKDMKAVDKVIQSIRVASAAGE